MSKRARASPSAESPFERVTTVREWTAPSGRVYVVRHPAQLDFERDGLPLVSLERELMNAEEEPEEDADAVELLVCGGVWTSAVGIVGFWAEDTGDGHVDLFVRQDYEHVAELDLVTEWLYEVAPPLGAWLDDGSGTDRDGLALPASVLEALPIAKLL